MGAKVFNPRPKGIKRPPPPPGPPKIPAKRIEIILRIEGDND